MKNKAPQRGASSNAKKAATKATKTAHATNEPAPSPSDAALARHEGEDDAARLARKVSARIADEIAGSEYECPLPMSPRAATFRATSIVWEELWASLDGGGGGLGGVALVAAGRLRHVRASVPG